jgi:hypothetical protein
MHIRTLQTPHFLTQTELKINGFTAIREINTVVLILKIPSFNEIGHSLANDPTPARPHTAAHNDHPRLIPYIANQIENVHIPAEQFFASAAVLSQLVWGGVVDLGLHVDEGRLEQDLVGVGVF